MNVALVNPYYFGADTLARVLFVNMVLSDSNNVMNVDSRIDCALKCWKDVTCSRFSYNQLRNKCYLPDHEDDEDDDSEEDIELDPQIGTNTYMITTGRKRCPSEFTWQNDIELCYTLELSTLDWQNAKDACVQKGARLLKLDTVEKNVKICNVIRSNTDYNQTLFFIGATDQVVESVWRWSDGSRVQYENWAPGQPSGNGNCTAMAYLHGHKWIDHPCNRQMPYICELLQ